MTAGTGGGDVRDGTTAVSPTLPSTVRVLHVDDEPDHAELTATSLERIDERFDVTTAASADEGMAALDAEPYDCVVSDYGMPGEDGIEFLETVRDAHPDLPFILFTGRGSEEVASDAISAGVSDYLLKDRGTDQYATLARRIESAVSRSRAEKRLDDHLDRMTDAFYGLDERWRFTYVNERAATLLGRDREELLGRVVWEEFEAAPGSRLETEYRTAMRTGEPTAFEFRDESLEADFEVHVYPSETGLSVYFRDVSALKTSERELRELSERFGLALDGAEVGVWDWDVPTDELTFDERRAEMLGYDVSEVRTDFSAWEESVHPDDVDEAKAALEAHLEGETEYYRSDHRMRTSDGDWKWIRDRGQVVERDEEGEPLRAVGIHIDVSDEKERARALERYRRIVDEMPESVAIYDANARFAFVNDYLAERYETSAESLLEEPSRLIDRIRAGHDDDPFAELVDGERETLSGTVTVDVPSGDGLVVDYRLTRLEFGGSFDGVLGITRDVTDAIRREERLERTTARLEALFEHSPDMIDVHDEDGVIVDVNRSICRELGYEPEELIGKRVWDVDAELDPDEAMDTWGPLDLEETIRLETTYRRSDGSTFPAEVHVRRVDVQGDEQFLVSSRDVSERKAYERRIERENERLDEFASIVSHDLRNPLNVLSGYLELARGASGEEEASYFDRCERALGDMERLIDDLLTLARQGESVGELGEVRLDELVLRCWQGVEHDDVELVNDVEGAVLADEGRLKQLFENLLRNGVEHGGGTVTVGSLPDGFYVADDGPGIPPDRRERVFESGYTTSGSGTGFGLSIVERIAEAHGWEVTLTDADGSGTRFEFTGVERPER